MKDQDEENFINLLQPAPATGEKTENTDFSVDSLGIPILEDVVEEPPQVLQPASARGKEIPDAGAQEPPDYETLLTAMREYLKSQLEDDFGRISRQVVPAAIASATRNLQADMERELQRLLDDKLALLIEQSLDRQLGKHEPDLD